MQTTLNNTLHAFNLLNANHSRAPMRALFMCDGLEERKSHH
jgi:hypothetical protein